MLYAIFFAFVWKISLNESDGCISIILALEVLKYHYQFNTALANLGFYMIHHITFGHDYPSYDDFKIL